MSKIPRPISHGLPGIGRNEDGSIIIFSLFTFVMMLALGGLGIDTMRTESRRVDLQSTLDRAVLAAADLQQSRDPEAVVRDYFAKAGYPGDLPQVTVTDALNSRTVRASASMPVSTSFLRIIGMDSFDAPAVSSATESVSDVEIGLVLDVSGSMNDNNRLPRLKTAGKDFIDTMFKNIEPEHIAVSLVPYATQVNIGADLAAASNIATTHGHSYCVDLPASAYATTRASTGALVQAAHFDVEGFAPAPGTHSVGSYSNMSADTPNCRDTWNFELLAWSNRSRILKNRIDALSAGGWTSIEMGVNWGTALLDPATRPVLSNMIGRGKVDADLAGWPRDFNSPVGMKVLVVMTDGANTYDFRIKPPYNSAALSDVWLYGSDEYVVRIDHNTYFSAKTRDWLSALPPGGTRLSWADLFARMSVRQHAYHLRAQQHGSSSTARQDALAYWTSIIEHEGITEKNRRLKQICAAAREQGIVIFTIGFEIDQPGAVEAMADCASSPSHFYRVEGLQISTAFTSIATQIKALRLVQ